MSNLQLKLEALLEDVNREDGFTLRFISKFTNTLFLPIKWMGIPFVVYLLFEVMRW
jgi:hypothetical protein